MARLIIYRYGQPPKEVRIEPPGAVIGSGTGCDVVLQGVGISNWHARVRLGDTGAVVEPLNPRHRMALNDAPVTKRAPLADGDRIRIGDYDIEYRTPAAVAAPREPEASHPVASQAEDRGARAPEEAARLAESPPPTPEEASASRGPSDSHREAIRRWGTIMGVAAAVVLVGLALYSLVPGRSGRKDRSDVEDTGNEFDLLRGILVRPDEEEAVGGPSASRRVPARPAREERPRTTRRDLGSGRKTERASTTSKRRSADAGTRAGSVDLTRDLQNAIRLYDSGQRDSAVTALARALGQIQSSGASADASVVRRARRLLAGHYCNTAATHFERGDFELAKVCWTQAAEVHPGSREAEAGLGKLEQKAKALYDDGMSVGSANMFYAMKRWREAARIAPANSETRREALRMIAQYAGR